MQTIKQLNSDAISNQIRFRYSQEKDIKIVVTAICLWTTYLSLGSKVKYLIVIFKF